jgi:hypothetical protein
MSDSGAQSPGTVATSANGGSFDWAAGTSPTIWKRAGGTVSYTTLYTYLLSVTNFGFTIPAGATINGVVDQIRRCRQGSGGLMYDEIVQQIVSGSLAGSNLADTGTAWSMGTTLTSASYGAVDSVWGCTLTPDIVNASNFGTGFQVKMMRPATSGDMFADVDYIRKTVYYTAAAVSASMTRVFVV